MSTQAVAAHRMRGLTLVELLVSLTLGLLLVVATTAGYLGLSEAARMAEAQARMNEDGQAALAVLASHLRMAGSNPDRPNRSPATRRNPVYPSPFAFAVRGCDGTFANVASAPSVQDLTCAGGTSPAPDSVSITYEVDRYNTVTLGPGWDPTDCLGRPLSPFTATVTVIAPPPGPPTETDISYHAAENRFYIDASDSTGTPSLFCKGNGTSSNASPLVENVEDLQLTYGTVPPGAALTNTAIAGYLDASDLAGHPAFAGASEAERWGKVASVRICVVVRSNRPVVHGEGSARYVKCDGTIETSVPDSYLRRAYSTTVVLRNRR